VISTTVPVLESVIFEETVCRAHSGIPRETRHKLADMRRMPTRVTSTTLNAIGLGRGSLYYEPKWTLRRHKKKKRWHVSLASTGGLLGYKLLFC
jgi:hypothetical protein